MKPCENNTPLEEKTISRPLAAHNYSGDEFLSSPNQKLMQELLQEKEKVKKLKQLMQEMNNENRGLEEQLHRSKREIS